MRVLITGSAGFLGRWLTDELLAHGYDVVGVDIAQRVRPIKSSRMDLTEPGNMRRAIGLFSPDVVVHMAAQVGRLFGEDDILHTIKSNAEMTALVAQACADNDTPLIYFSTSEIYGDQGAHRVCNEDGPKLVPHNLYGLSKRWGEEVCELYHPYRHVVVRPSMPYGPGAPPGRGRRAMDNFLWQAYHGMPITVHKGAERSWCWVGDTVRGVRLILERHFARSTAPLAHKSYAYNVGRDDDPISMRKLAVMACDLASAPYDLIEEVDPPGRQTVVKRLSTDRLRSLGWAPTIDLEEGLEKVYRWVQNFDKDGNPVRVPA